MKGSLEYYIHERWKPNESELAQLVEDFETHQNRHDGLMD
jgi:hypothetical protein